MNEEALLRRCLQGEEAAWSELINKYKNKVFNIAYRILHNREEAEDVTEKTFMHVFKSLKSFRRHAKFSTWLYRIVINLSLNSLQQRTKTMVLEEADLRVSTEHNGNSLVLKKERQRVIRRAIESLPKEYQIVIVLREYDQLSYDEIAQILKIPKGTVESRLYRARQLLKELLKDYIKG